MTSGVEQIGSGGGHAPRACDVRVDHAAVARAIERPASYWAFLTIENRKTREAERRDGLTPFPAAPAPGVAQPSGPGPARVEDMGRPAPLRASAAEATPRTGLPRIGEVSPNAPTQPVPRARHVMHFRVHTNLGRLIDITA